MKLFFSLIMLLFPFNSQVFAAMPVERFDGPIVNATYLGHDENYIYGQTESGEELVLPVGARSGASFRRVPRTSCFTGNFIYVCFGVKSPPKFPEGVYDLNLGDANDPANHGR